ncbi:MAG: Asp-tRNA(Asn)/Glu-tRNA(Gln) amidotransferase subunit GatA [Aquificae bacterium]|nr:Asp-tRNA(Asn)/Glu-tRNA(Gln) amidotransferase subunit GatA [Aquificota bacterium]
MLWKKPLGELRRALLRGELTPAELIESYYERFNRTEDKIKAFITPLYEQALEQARKLKEPRGKLWGIPVAVKDNILTEGYRTTCASKILENFVAPYDATVVKRIKDEGALIVGKTNLDEFAMGSSTEHSAFFPTRNPWDLERVPGGSSGGSAAAVAALSAPLALGSDTGGSIRQPAAFCGVIGIKPTYGRVSRYGLVAFASSLDQIGVFGRRTEEVALLLEVISGKDERDSTSADEPVPRWSESFSRVPEKLRLGVVKEATELGIQKEVLEVFNEFLKALEKEGHELVEVSLPALKYAVPTYYIVAPSEASSNLARYDGVRYGYRSKEYRDVWEMYAKTRAEGFGPEVKRRIMLGTFALSAGYYDAYYLKAQKVRRLIADEFEEAFKRVDALVTPTAPTLPFKLGERLDDPIKMYMSDVLTVPASLAGLPAVSVPAGWVNGLPVGVQFIGRRWDEELLLQLSYLWEQLSRHYEKVPLEG